MEPAITAKHATLVKLKRQLSIRTIAAFGEVSFHTKMVACMCANAYWLKLFSDIQASTNCGNI